VSEGSATWKDGVLPEDAEYRREGAVLGREELLGSRGPLWAESEFVGRAETPHTTSAMEAKIRKRQLERIVEGGALDAAEPALELGCADGLVTRHLLELGFEKLVSTDLEHATVARLESSLSDAEHERVMLIVDDLLKLPFGESAFATVIAWGVLSVSGDFERALELSWEWTAPGGHLLLAEPVLESVLLYALVRGDVDEFRRILREGSRPAGWENREDRYGVNKLGFYRDRLAQLQGATVVDEGGVSILPSLILGGIAQDRALPERELDELDELLSDPDLDELLMWRQAYWLVRKG
jgi:SAM-dependent methyltransferase